MSINILPPEILRQILSDLSDFPYSSSYERNRQRNRDLLSCSLVCSTWRTIAQELLPDEIWIRQASRSDKEGLERLGSTLDQEAFRRSRSTRMVIQCWDPRSHGLGRKEVDSRWTSLKFLRVMSAELSVEVIASLVNLTKLHLEKVHFGVHASQGVKFPHLSHLLFMNSKLRGDSTSLQAVFSPTTMPKLVHLILDAYHDTIPLKVIFASLLPQVSSLALPESLQTPRDPNLLDDFPRSNILKHLSLSSFQAQFLSATTVFRLETLHLRNIDAVGIPLRPDAVSPSELGKREYLEALETKEKLGASQVVLYGCSDYVREHVVNGTNEGIVWKREQYPSFDNLDGSF